MAAPNPTYPGLYCDPLFTTSVIPANSPITGDPKLALAASINGVVFPYSNPTSQAQMISFVNTVMSGVAYGAPTGFDCATMCRPSRYVIMGGGATPNAADQLLVDAAGNIIYNQTNWQAPPF